uniref:DUF3179 domain-containing protein n=1 Tax=Chromera velia CCMP2878 TaxID=1169474 RepID=A0A0G4HAA7_9ALVE|eukprot:Cvel_25639.t1-p1 / transcript=Cvel_25639.t1 / gene=Cvel_25639 / organism=Chromera_velia_CCMP2878 / gene_product=hypothetical protein / transcript_product=hypothetical protein / location=Cvel_scaffold2932:4347-5675(+) / protein_length=443 / sequence_SO=supercontig / SO=protein_coding / is_pseudo=false
MATRISHKVINRVLFGVTGVTAAGASAWLFRDLADLSQWVVKTDRSEVFSTFHHRHEIAATWLASSAANTAVFFRTRCVSLPVWAVLNLGSFAMFFSGYVNPEIMMRPRNKNAVYVPAEQALELLDKEETVIVTQVGDAQPRAFPDSQVLRPHAVRAGATASGVPVTMTYCGLTNLGIAYETPNHEDGSQLELVPLTQLENNLVLMDKSSGHVGQQINGIDEDCLRKKLGTSSYRETARRMTDEDLAALSHTALKEVPTWRMSLGAFANTYPGGEVFINDYKMFKSILKAPVRSLYDSIIDFIFETAIRFQSSNPQPVFPTIENPDTRLPPKEKVWAFNVGDDYVAVTEDFVRRGTDGVRYLTVGGVRVVASWDGDAESLGVWKLPPGWTRVCGPVDVHGRIAGQRETDEGGLSLERVETVKAGAYWVVWSNFFPQTRVNPLQ